jgi:hypothetical protein
MIFYILKVIEERRRGRSWIRIQIQIHCTDPGIRIRNQNVTDPQHW